MALPISYESEALILDMAGAFIQDSTGSGLHIWGHRMENAEPAFELSQSEA